MHRVSISRNDVNIDINLLTTYLISAQLTFTFTDKFTAFLCLQYTLSVDNFFKFVHGAHRNEFITRYGGQFSFST